MEPERTRGQRGRGPLDCRGHLSPHGLAAMLNILGELPGAAELAAVQLLASAARRACLPIRSLSSELVASSRTRATNGAIVGDEAGHAVLDQLLGAALIGNDRRKPVAIASITP